MTRHLFRRKASSAAVLFAAMLSTLVMARADLAKKLESALTLWPEADRKTLTTAVATAAARQEHPFATFDADGTLWSSDATEAFVAWLEANGLLTPDRLGAELKVIPFLKDEGVYSYYQRLCGIDNAVGYPFVAQVFAGFTLAELRGHYEAMMKTQGSTVRVWKDGAFVEEFVPVPKLFPQQVQLIRALESNGIRVHIVTASSEELIRFLVCDPPCHPSFDLHLPPERVIGVNLLLKDPETGDVTSSRLRLAKAPALFDDTHTREKWEKLRVTSFVLPPVTMYSGKVAAITGFIDPVRPPVLVAGDSANDFPALFYSAGARVWVRHNYTPSHALDEAMKAYQRAADPQRGWVHGTWDLKK